MQNVKEKSKQILGPKSINILDRQRTEILGALEIVSSTEREINIKLSNSFMVISGEGLTILKLSPEEEVLIISGQLNGINFQSKMTRKSLFGKVFK